MENRDRYREATFSPETSGVISNAVKDRISQINRQGMRCFRPLITAILSRYSADEDKASLVEETLAAIERFSFIYFMLGGNGSSGYRKEFSDMARFVARGKDADGAAFGIENVLARLTDLTGSNREKCVKTFMDTVSGYFADVGGYCRWKGIHYFFYEYECGKRGDGESRLSWDTFARPGKNRVSVERILPQPQGSKTVAAAEEDIRYWSGRFSEFSGGERNELAGAIGNLLALSRNIDPALQYQSYPKKRRPENGERERGYCSGSYSEMEVAQENDDWTAAGIYERSVKLIRFMNERWGLNLSGEQMRRLVRLEFVAEYMG